MSAAKKKAAKRSRNSPIGRYNSYIYSDTDANDACARFAYRYPIELVRAYEAVERNNPDNQEILQRIIKTRPERDRLTDQIITAIMEISPMSITEGRHEATMSDVLSWVTQGCPVHKMEQFRGHDDPAKALRDKIYGVAKKLGKKISSGAKRGRRNADEIIRMALYSWWADNIEGTDTVVGVDNYGNPKSGSKPVQPSSGPSRDDLRPYLLQHGMNYPPDTTDDTFWKLVHEQAEWRNNLPICCWHIPLDNL